MSRRTLYTTAVVVAFLALALAGVQPAAAQNYSASGLSVWFAPVKDSFRVGEPIRFKVSGNQDFYLYLFSVDNRSNKGYIILPNRLQQANRYQAGRQYTVPEKRVEFFSDQPGLERIIMVASTRRLQLSTQGYGQAGHLYASDAGTIESQAKSIRVRQGGGVGGNDQVMAELQVAVRAKGEAPGGPGHPGGPRTVGPEVFVFADQVVYRHNSPMMITYGASQSGYVYLYSVEPDGQVKFLAKRPVQAQVRHNLEAVASGQMGRYKLVAVYDRGGAMAAEAFLPALEENQASAIRTRGKPQPARHQSVFNLEIIY